MSGESAYIHWGGSVGWIFFRDGSNSMAFHCKSMGRNLVKKHQREGMLLEDEVTRLVQEINATQIMSEEPDLIAWALMYDVTMY